MTEPQKRVAMTVVVGDQKREITFDELTLSNNLALESLVKLLVDKNVFKVEELQKVMDEIRKQRYADPTGQQQPDKQ
jgi:hypothetical protein